MSSTIGVIALVGEVPKSQIVVLGISETAFGQDHKAQNAHQGSCVLGIVKIFLYKSRGGHLK